MIIGVSREQAMSNKHLRVYIRVFLNTHVKLFRTFHQHQKICFGEIVCVTSLKRKVLQKFH